MTNEPSRTICWTPSWSELWKGVGLEHLLLTKNAADSVVLAIDDDGVGVPEDVATGTGLSIVRALVRDELRGTLHLQSGAGTRAEVVFPT
jgi:two-component sensor histidine kinase